MYRKNSPPPVGEGPGGVPPHTSLSNTTILSLPQRPYLPHDTLRANLCYPARDGIDDAILKRALEQVGLAQLQDQLDVTAKMPGATASPAANSSA